MPERRAGSQYRHTMKITRCDIRLEQLRLYAYHGVLEQERRVGAFYTLDVTLSLAHAEGAVLHDELASTVNYAEVYDLVRQEFMQPSQLLEHVAGRLLQAILFAFPAVAAAAVTVRKDNPPMGADCAGCSVTLAAER